MDKKSLLEISNAISRISSSIRDTFTSPNVRDSNGEKANLVDVIDELAASMDRIASGLESVATAIRDSNKCTH